MLEALETPVGINVLRVIVQLATLVLASFAGGIALGRFIYARALEQKDSEIANKNAEIQNISSRSELLLLKLDKQTNLDMLRKDICEYNRQLPTSRFKKRTVLPSSLQLILDENGVYRLKRVSRAIAREIDTAANS